MTTAGRIRLGVAALTVAATAAACSATVAGQGSVAAPNGPGSSSAPTGFPSTPVVPTNSISGPTAGPSGSAPVGTPSTPVVPSNSISVNPSSASSSTSATHDQDFTCPSIVDPGIELEWTCITSSMTYGRGGIWPNDFAHVVEPATKWAVTTGDGHWGSRGGHSLKAICLDVRGQMVKAGSYGTKPTVRTLHAGTATINGAAGYVVESGFRLSPAFRARSGTKVRYEKSWIVAVRIGKDDYDLWYVSIPDIAKALWSKVHDTIASIHVIP